MTARVDRGPVVMLAVDLDQSLPDLAQQLHAHADVVEEGAASAVSRLNAAQDEQSHRPRMPFSASSAKHGMGRGQARRSPSLGPGPRRAAPATHRLSPPMASEKASSRIDLPAPVSPVSTQQSWPNSRSSLSIRTMSRIDRAPLAWRERSGRCGVALPGLCDPRPFMLLRLHAVSLQECRKRGRTTCCPDSCGPARQPPSAPR